MTSPVTLAVCRTAIVALVVALSLGVSSAQGDTGSAYFRQLAMAVQDHPAIEAARLGVVAAERQLAGSRQPVELSLEGSYTRYIVAGDNADAFPQPDPQFNARVTAHPFLYGDLADQEAQRIVELERAKITLRETQASVEAQAVFAALDVSMARASVALAQDALDVAQRALAATETRAERGAARAADVDRARQDAARAEAELAQAERSLALAQAALEAWTGGARLPTPPNTVPAWTVATGTPTAVARARLDVQLAQVGLSSAERTLWPVAQASYSWLLDEDRGTVTVGLESRTLSPSLSYQTSTPAPVSNGASGSGTAPATMPATWTDLAPMQAMPEPPRATAGFSIGVSLTLSPQRFDALEAARARVDAARAGLEAAERRASLERRGLLDAIAQAEDQLRLAQGDLALAERDLADTDRRVELGLATDLERARQWIAVRRAELAVLQAESALARARLDTYTHAATPLSEVLK